MGYKVFLGTCFVAGVGVWKVCGSVLRKGRVYDTETVLLKADRVRRGEYWGIVVEFRSEGGSSIPKEYLAERVLAIVTENPWLAGRIIGKHLVWASSLQHDTYDHGFLTILTDQMLHDVPFTDFPKGTLAPYLTQSNHRTHKLFNLYAWETDGGYCLMVSMSRMVADAFTFFTIVNMLSRAMDVVPLMAERVLKDECKQWLPIRGWVPGWAKRVLGGVGGEYAVCIGEDYDPESAKCSAIDGVVSWWLSLGKHTAGNRGLTVDLRNHSPFYSRQMAGNYTSSLVFKAQQHTTPSAIYTLAANCPPTTPSCSTPPTQATDLTPYYHTLLLPHSTHVAQHLFASPSLTNSCYIFKSTEHDVHLYLTPNHTPTPDDSHVICKLV